VENILPSANKNSNVDARSVIGNFNAGGYFSSVTFQHKRRSSEKNLLPTFL
jgi:hypothetical protein